MTDMMPLAKKILLLKETMSYAEFSKAIFQRTGKRLSANGLQKLGSGNRAMGRLTTIQVLAEYAEKPLSWFYEDENYKAPETVAEAQARYTANTGDLHENAYRRELLEAYIAAGAELSIDQLEVLAKIARMMKEDRPSGSYPDPKAKPIL